MKAITANRRRPIMAALFLLVALLMTGAAYATFNPHQGAKSAVTKVGNAEQGQKLFMANCATCHGPQAAGVDNLAPSLIGVGAAAVDFQVGSGRMPMQNTAPQAPRKPVELSDQDRADLAAYVASLGAGPAIPSADAVKASKDPAMIANGSEIFRVNCAMCHNVVGAGGALTRGKFAPSLNGVSEQHLYEAMVTGPQSMPVFSDANLSPKNKQEIISYLKFLEETPSPGGWSLGSLGPVSEGLFAWLGAITILIGLTVWIGAKSS